MAYNLQHSWPPLESFRFCCCCCCLGTLFGTHTHLYTFTVTAVTVHTVHNHNQLHSGSHTTHLEAVALGGNIAGLQDATTQHSFRLREGSATTSKTAFAGGQLPRFMSSSRNGSTRTVTTLWAELWAQLLLLLWLLLLLRPQPVKSAERERASDLRAHSSSCSCCRSLVCSVSLLLVSLRVWLESVVCMCVSVCAWNQLAQH